jgi:hypothetical protein
VGGVAIKRLLGRTGLAELIGARFEYGDAVAVPLPHPSGASGWLNEPSNRRLVERAASVIRNELERTGTSDSEPPPASRHASGANA